MSNEKQCDCFGCQLERKIKEQLKMTVVGKETPKAEPQRNDLGYDHSQEDLSMAIDVNQEELTNKINSIGEAWVKKEGSNSVLVEDLQRNLTPKELAAVAANSIIEHQDKMAKLEALKNGGIEGLIKSMMGEGGDA